MVIAGLVEALAEFNPVTITGATPLPTREAAIETFQNDPACRLFIGNLQAAGEAITLDAARDVYLVESDFVPARNDQALDARASGR